jgi:hypothetical protein
MGGDDAAVGRQGVHALIEAIEYETIAFVEQTDHRLARIERMLAECAVVATNRDRMKQMVRLSDRSLTSSLLAARGVRVANDGGQQANGWPRGGR